MSPELQKVLAQIEKTGSWYGEKISDLNQHNMIDDTPLHTACSWGQLEPVKVLVEAGADVNARGDLGATPLFNAVIGKNAEVVKYLIQEGADPGIVNNDGKPVSEYARNISASPEILQILKEKKGKSK